MNAVAEHVTTTTPPVRPLVQTRLRVGAVDDPLERQADEVAERVLRMPDPGPAMRRRGSDETLIRRCPGGCPPTGCEESESTVQRLHDEGFRQPVRSFGSASTAHVPLAVHQTVRSPGRPLDARPREHMEARFGHRFDHVRIHTDDRAAKSAQAINARAYTVGNHIVFGSGTFAPASATGRRLLAHELAHVLQQGDTEVATRPQPQVTQTPGGGTRIAVAPDGEQGPDGLERQAEAIADGVARDHAAGGRPVNVAHGRMHRPAIQPVRLRVPSSIPLCGATLTHIDVEPPRWRPLQPCLPATVLVNRVNMVGREVSSRTTGRGRQIFNLHAGYYRDPVTGRLCAIVDDSKRCIAPRCLSLGCFPTLREVVDAILDFLKKALTAIGLVLLAILLFILGRGLIRGGPRPGPVPIGSPPVLIAEAGSDGDEDVSEEAQA